jgi:esterase
MSDNRVEVGFRTYGVGPQKIIVLHSLFSDGTSFAPMLPGFDPETVSFAFVDVRGFGLSAAIGGPYTMSTIAQDAISIADRLGWEQFSVIGHSMGGKAALRVAIDAPNRVERIIGLGPVWAAPVPFEPPALARFRSSVSNLADREAIVAGSTGGRLPPIWSRTVARTSFALSRPEAYTGYLESFAFEDFEAAAAALTQPALVIVGAHDAAMLRMAQAGWQAKMRRAKVTILEQCGHYPHQEASLLTAALIQGFLFDHEVGA